MPFDLSKAKHLNDYHIQVEDQLFFGDVILIENVDLESFTIPYPDLIQNLAMDKNHVFLKER